MGGDRKRFMQCLVGRSDDWRSYNHKKPFEFKFEITQRFFYAISFPYNGFLIIAPITFWVGAWMVLWHKDFERAQERSSVWLWVGSIVGGSVGGLILLLAYSLPKCNSGYNPDSANDSPDILTDLYSTAFVIFFCIFSGYVGARVFRRIWLGPARKPLVAANPDS